MLVQGNASPKFSYKCKITSEGIVFIVIVSFKYTCLGIILEMWIPRGWDL